MTDPTFLDSKKARALLIALVNCDLVFIAALVFKADATLTSSMITATLTLSAIYIGAQGAVDTVNATKGKAE